MDSTIKDFEAAIAELETIVKKLEEGDLPLEQSLELYERGVQLSRFCHARLEEAERRIEMLNERGELKPAPPSLANPRAEDGPRQGARPVTAPTALEGISRRAPRARGRRALTRWLPPPPACPPIVSEAMRYSATRRRQALPAVLALAAAEAIAVTRRAGTARAGDVRRGRRPLAMPAACALEMIHTYSLIHDDLPAMDNDTLRRGRPTLHVVYGEGMAILAGDGLLTEAFALLAREPDSATTRGAGRAQAAGPGRSRTPRARRGMVGGQAIDLQAVGREAPSDRRSLDARPTACATCTRGRPAR